MIFLIYHFKKLKINDVIKSITYFIVRLNINYSQIKKKKSANTKNNTYILLSFFAIISIAQLSFLSTNCFINQSNVIRGPHCFTKYQQEYKKILKFFNLGQGGKENKS